MRKWCENYQKAVFTWGAGIVGGGKTATWAETWVMGRRTPEDAEDVFPDRTAGQKPHSRSKYRSSVVAAGERQAPGLCQTSSSRSPAPSSEALTSSSPPQTGPGSPRMWSPLRPKSKRACLPAKKTACYHFLLSRELSAAGLKPKKALLPSVTIQAAAQVSQLLLGDKRRC